MSQPIGNKKVDYAGAPTPQNTPLNNAPISSHAVDPKVPSIAEEDRALAATMLATNPHLLSMVEGKLGSLIGRSSGYIESLPYVVRQRITGLKGIQKDHSKLEAEFQEEVLQLEKKYLQKFTPLYQKRAKIINGDSEPTKDEIKAGEEEEEEAEGEKEEKTEEGADTKGVPEFWLTAMKNSTSLSETITDRDEGALKCLTDIRMEYLEQPGFRLIFEFSENEFFTNKTITKTYFYKDESGYGGDFIYDHAEGDKIDWKPGKDLTVRIESKKQRNKNTKQTRVIKRTVPTDSFFNFFTPPKAINEDDEDDASSDIEERLELDYQLGEDIKEKLIPRAIDWYTGEALQFEEFEDIDDDELEDDEDDDDDLSDEDRDDDDEESDEEDESGKPKQQEAAECKQS